MMEIRSFDFYFSLQIKDKETYLGKCIVMTLHIGEDSFFDVFLSYSQVVDGALVIEIQERVSNLEFISFLMLLKNSQKNGFIYSRLPSDCQLVLFIIENVKIHRVLNSFHFSLCFY